VTAVIDFSGCQRHAAIVCKNGFGVFRDIWHFRTLRQRFLLSSVKKVAKQFEWTNRLFISRYSGHRNEVKLIELEFSDPFGSSAAYSTWLQIESGSLTARGQCYIWSKISTKFRCSTKMGDLKK
jgi:hypothetical protein